MAPFVIPGIVLAIGFYAAYAPPPLALYGTALILILAFTTRFLPIAYSSQRRHPRINPEMEEAVRILGGGRYGDPQGGGAAAQAQSGGRLDPGLHPGDARAVVGDLPVRARHRVISVMIFDISEEGNFEYLAALGAASCWSLTVVIAGSANALIGRDFMLRRYR